MVCLSAMSDGLGLECLLTNVTISLYILREISDDTKLQISVVNVVNWSTSAEEYKECLNNIIHLQIMV